MIYFMDKKPECVFCNRIRLIVICVAIAGFVAYRPEFDFLKNYDNRAVAFIISLSVLALIGWKGYREFWKER